MSTNLNNAPTVNFSPALLNFYRAALELHADQSGTVIEVKPTVEPAKSKPAKPTVVAAPTNVDAPYGMKTDGSGPRLKPKPTWLPNVKPDSDAPTAKSSKSKPAKPAKPAKPTIAAPTIVVPEPATIAEEVEAWMIEPARNGSTQHIRIVAAQLALFGAQSRKLTLILTDKFDTKGEASAHYQSELRPRVAAKNLDIRHGSTNWKNAATMIARAMKRTGAK